MPTGWEPLFVMAFCSPVAGLLGAGLAWLLRKAIPNTVVRVAGSMVVAGTATGAGLLWLIAYLSF